MIELKHHLFILICSSKYLLVELPCQRLLYLPRRTRTSLRTQNLPWFGRNNIEIENIEDFWILCQTKLANDSTEEFNYYLLNWFISIWFFQVLTCWIALSAFALSSKTYHDITKNTKPPMVWKKQHRNREYWRLLNSVSNQAGEWF